MLGLHANTCRLGFKAVVTIRATRYGFNYPWVKCPSMWKTVVPCVIMHELRYPVEHRCETTMCAANPAERHLAHSEIVLIRLLYLQLYQRLATVVRNLKKEILKGSTGDWVNTCNQGNPPLMIGWSDPSVKHVGSNKVLAKAKHSL